MRKATYRYNPETCQYERARVNVRSILFYLFGVVVVAALMLGGMLTLHDYLIDSEKEIALRKENNALTKNQIVLASQLAAIESSLALLQEEDERLHSKFFGTPLEKEFGKRHGIADRNVLLSDASAFRNTIMNISDHSATLLRHSSGTNVFFGSKVMLKTENTNFLAAMPTLPPLQPWNNDQLISGFGMRVNPFHKGLYEHPGIDVTMPRGTSVLASSSGKVTQVKRSNLQAGYGNYIEIDHGHGFVTRYAHLEEIKVRLYERVDKGSVIGTVGSSGGSIAPHLHYEILRDGRNVDPVTYMIEGLTSKDHHEMKVLSRKKNQSLD